MTLTELTLASLPFAYFLFVSSVTPGPNNLMLAASGMNYGVRRSLPHMFGIAFGFGLMMFLCAIGVGAIYKSWPGFRIILNVFSAIYLLYLSYKIATAESIDVNNKNSKSKPMTFLQAALFQYVNPKAWVMALACVSAFMPAGATMAQQTLIIIVMAIIINLPCTGIWAVFGHGMARLFTTDKSRRIVNAVLAILLVATIPMMML